MERGRSGSIPYANWLGSMQYANWPGWLAHPLLKPLRPILRAYLCFNWP